MDTQMQQMLAGHERPVILLEGTRNLPAGERDVLVRLAHWLCRQFPKALFRSGNAEGTDAVFADAVASHDPSRLELVLPHPGMGRARRPANVRCLSLDALPRAELEQIGAATRRAGRDAGRLADYYLSLVPPPKSAAASKATYLLRDTLKVVGSTALGLAPSDLGIFFVNADRPAGGGTGHTIKVCQLHGVPVATQTEWATWVSPR
jgi:hypothetical protein